MSEQSLQDLFISALRDLSEWLDSFPVPYTTIGGVAVSLLAQPRATRDIDVVVWLDESRWKNLWLKAAEHGLESRIQDPLEFAANSRVLLLKHSGSGIGLDVIFGGLAFEKEMIESAASLRLGGFTIKVPSPEHLIVTKALAQRGRDLEDIESILEAFPLLNLERIRFWAGQFANALDMPEIAECVEAALKRKRRG